MYITGDTMRFPRGNAVIGPSIGDATQDSGQRGHNLIQFLTTLFTHEHSARLQAFQFQVMQKNAFAIHSNVPELQRIVSALGTNKRSTNLFHRCFSCDSDTICSRQLYLNRF
jgi:hypothetical protein